MEEQEFVSDSAKRAFPQALHGKSIRSTTKEGSGGENSSKTSKSQGQAINYASARQQSASGNTAFASVRESCARGATASTATMMGTMRKTGEIISFHSNATNGAST